MSAKNYAGFNYNGGAQYIAPTTATAAANFNAAPGPAAYPVVTNANYANEYQTAGGYAAANAATNYGYDYSQSYYQQASANYNAGATPSKTHYSAPPVKNINATGKGAGKNKANGKQTGPAPPPPAPAVGYVNYEAIYNAASLYVQQQQQQQQQQQHAANNKQVNHTYSGNWVPYKGGRRNAAGAAAANRANDIAKSRLHYCEVCKISCAGPQSYREHLDGQKHKKREAASKLQATTPATVQNKGNNQHCELCDVTCTGNDAYAAHVRGSKHQRVLKLHQKLGKPIPVEEPKVVEPVTEKVKPTESDGNKAPNPEATIRASNANDDTDPSTAHIKPVGGEYIDEIKDDEGKMISFNCKLCECKFNDPNAKEMHMKGRRHRLQYKRKVQPDLIVDFKPTQRQRFLAEARAQRALMQAQRGVGNRNYHSELENGSMYWDDYRGGQYGGGGGGVGGGNDYGNWMSRGFAGGPQRSFAGRPGGNGPPFFGGMTPVGAGPRRPDSMDDRHAIARHAEIYPKEEELQTIQRIVSHTERALKFVSDTLTGKPDENAAATAVKQKEKTEGATPVKDGRDNQMFSFQKDADSNTNSVRCLKGVMRVGFLAKGLLLQGDNAVELVVLCSEKPTVGLLKRVAAELPNKLKEVAGEQNPPIEYHVELCVEESAIYITDDTVSVSIYLTSPLLRDAETAAAEMAKPEEVNANSADETILPLGPCLQALAELRRAKWFQARATGLQSCVMAIRILRDLCHRVPSWQALPQWSLELLVEKVISSAGFPLSPGDCLRRIMEAIASGLLINGPGLADPCEKEPYDTLEELSKQQREDLTVSAQQFLRYIAFRQIYKVLGMEHLPPMKFPARPWQMNRKRLRSAGNSGGGAATDKTTDADEKATEVKVAKI